MFSLVFRVRKIYFDRIEKGEKPIEYRRNSPFWRKRVQRAKECCGVETVKGKIVFPEPSGVLGVFICGKRVHRRPITVIECLKTPSWFSAQGQIDINTKTCFGFHLEKAPEGAAIFGKCPSPFCDAEYAWLFPSDCDDKPWCEGCIDEAHDRLHDAEDAMAEVVDTDDSFIWEDPDTYDDELDWGG